MKIVSLNPDVIIVGAGTSGLSAASALNAAGYETLVLESAGHSGGRCVTDHSTFSIPFDRGGSWIHSAEINPLAGLAAQQDFELHKTPWISEQVMIDGQKLSNDEVRDYRAYVELMWDSVVEMGSIDNALSIERSLPLSKWKDTAMHLIPQMLAGDPDVTCAADMANYAASPGDWLVGNGLGNFIQFLYKDLAVELNCPVETIDYTGPKVRVTTPHGTAEADHLIVTVSTGVLAAETIEFRPVLPDTKQEAIACLPNGLLNKVGIEFDPVWDQVCEGYQVDYHKNNEEFCTLLFAFYNSSLATGFVAGRFADFLEKEGEGAATNFCVEALCDTFGSDVRKYIRKTSETAWRGNQHTLGSYSYALPGFTQARKTLAESIDERVFFAGEATRPNEFATVHGAYMSGKDVAKQIIELKLETN